MPMTEQEIQDQLNGKMHWDASETEVRNWLAEKHGIRNEKADLMIERGISVKRAAIRRTSIMRLIVALVVATPLGGLTWLSMQAEGRTTDRVSLALGGACLVCLGYAGKNLIQVLTGNSDTAIDA